MFLSSHILSEVQKYCKHAAVIRDGNILVNDSVEKLGQTGAKRVILHGVNKVPELDGQKILSVTDNSVEFLYSRRYQTADNLLASLPLTDFTVTEPDLEEIFMHYYTKEGAAHDDFSA